MHASKTNSVTKKIAALTSLLTLSLVASLSGTFAWYQYTIYAGLGYYGTAIGNTKLLQVGLKSEVELKDYQKHNFEKDPVLDNVYWSRGDLDSEKLDYFFESNGYATNKFAPVTSGSYKDGDVLELMTNPTHLENGSKTQKADKHFYQKIPVVFKVIDKNTNEGMPNIPITLTCKVGTMSHPDMIGAMRMHIDTSCGKDKKREKFICDLSDGNFDDTLKELPVGGILDLNNDGYYDYDIENSNKEFIYGEYESLEYKNTPNEPSEPLSEEEGSTFLANHREGMYTYDSAKTIFKTAQYHGAPSGYTFYTSEDTKLADFTITNYIEGWSQNAVQRLDGSYFNMILRFDIH